jgi:hypothetical protein
MTKNNRPRDLIWKFFHMTPKEFNDGVRKATSQMSLLGTAPEGELYFYSGHFQSWVLLGEESVVVVYAGGQGRTAEKVIAELVQKRELVRGCDSITRSTYSQLWDLLYVAFWKPTTEDVWIPFLRGGDWMGLCAGERLTRTERDAPLSWREL